MANWCEGKLKVRGDEKQIERFLLEALINDKRVIEQDEYGMTLRAPEGTGFYVKGTYRNLVDSNIIRWGRYEPVLELTPYRGAWRVDVGVLAELSEQYEIDMKIFSYEWGNLENVDFEVHKGQIVRYQFFKYNSYEEYHWGCLEPHLGG